MDNGMNYYGDQPVYSYDTSLYNMEPQEQMYAQDAEPAELPPEPEDSPYADPVVRHILTLRDDSFRKSMLSYLNENVRERPSLHPAYVMVALVLCFPVGLCMMYFGTKWGTFSKVVITLFTLAIALVLYEILVAYSVIPTPSLIGTVIYIIAELFG